MKMNPFLPSAMTAMAIASGLLGQEPAIDPERAANTIILDEAGVENLRIETVLAEEARKEGADGIVCGHIHHAADEMIGDMHYLNTGDWVESCTAIVEHHDGRMEIIDWAAITRERARALSATTEAARLARPARHAA